LADRHSRATGPPRLPERTSMETTIELKDNIAVDFERDSDADVF
jgi:hypothetical protein